MPPRKRAYTPTGYGRGRPKSGEVRESANKKNQRIESTPEMIAAAKAPPQSMFRVCDKGWHMQGRNGECGACKKGLGPTPEVVEPGYKPPPRPSDTDTDARSQTSSPLSPDESRLAQIDPGF